MEEQEWTKPRFIRKGLNMSLKDMQNRALISILIPVYNAQDFLAECLESVLCQTYKNLEIICIDDGSTDNSPSILQRYAKRDKRVRVFYQENRGAAFTRNRLLTETHGEYFAFIDADDTVSAQYIEKLYQVAIASQSDIVRSLYYLHDMSSNHLIPCDDVYKGFKRPEPSQKPVCRIQAALDDTQVWLKLIKTSFVKKHHIQFLNDAVVEDISFEILMYLYASKISFLNEYLYYYRVGNPSSLSSNKQVWAGGTLSSICFVCRELMDRNFTDRTAWNLMSLLLLHSIRRMCKYPLGNRENEICTQAVCLVQKIRPLCSICMQWQLALFCTCCKYVSASKIPYVAWCFR